MKKSNVSNFELLVEIGYSLSQQFKGVESRNRRMVISTHLLGKQIEIAISLLKLLPESSFSTGKDKYIDFSSFASIARNLIEACNFHWYLSVEKITKEEELLRILLFDYHDNFELTAIARQLNFKKTDYQYLEDEQNKIREKIQKNSIFQKLSPDRQKRILNGKSSLLLTQTEIAIRRKMNISRFKGMYKLFSIHTHSSASAIKMWAFSRRLDADADNLNIILSRIIIEYCSSFLANSILKTGNQWKIQFAKKASAKLVNRYSRMLSLT